MIKYLKFTFFIFLLFNIIQLFEHDIYAQDKWWKDKKYRSETKRVKFYNCKKLFIDISDAINNSNINSIIYYFGSELYLNFLESEKGYYSPDQAKYIIENFLYIYPVHSFKWKLSNRSETYAFALGHYKFRNNGYINSYKVSTSLKYINERWQIDQIIVN